MGVRSMKKNWLPNRTGHVLSAGRALFALGVGAIASAILCIVVGAFEPFALTLWDVGASVLLALLWTAAWPMDSGGTKSMAEHEARRSTTDTAVLVATFASIAAVIVGLAESTNRADNLRQLIIALSAVAVVLSWAMVNTVFAFKYARLYYADEDGGIDFQQAEPPCYVDFAYLAFTMGVAFAVSETGFTSTALRRIALPHALLSYAYTTFLIGIVVSLVPLP
jgi:uncharacterized membrane protein